MPSDEAFGRFSFAQKEVNGVEGSFVRIALLRSGSALGGVYVEWRVANGSRDLDMVYGKSYFSPQTMEKSFLIGITDDEVQ